MCSEWNGETRGAVGNHGSKWSGQIHPTQHSALQKYGRSEGTYALPSGEGKSTLLSTLLFGNMRSEGKYALHSGAGKSTLLNTLLFRNVGDLKVNMPCTVDKSNPPYSTPCTSEIWEI
jgi:hypothetical protein